MPPKLGIIAGGGDLPFHVASACRAQGRDYFLLCLEGHAEPERAGEHPHDWIKLGAVSRGIALLRRAGAEELVMAGTVARPSLRALGPDLRAMRLAARVGLARIGDDALLKAIIAELEGEGFRFIGVADVLAEFVGAEGPLGRHRPPDDQARADIERGIAVARAVGALDVGQGAVVQEGIVLAVEAAEGTDAMLDRCAALRRPGPGGVLVKTAKPGQERRADLPTIGVRTVERAAAAGLRGIAYQAGAALIVDPGATAAAADRAGLFVVGVAVPE